MSATEIKQAKQTFGLAWELLVRKAGREEAERYALGKMRVKKAGRQKGVQTKLIREGLLNLASNGTKISPKRIANLLRRHFITPIPETNYVAVSSSELSEFIERRLKEKGVDQDNPKKMQYVVRDIFAEFFKPTVAAIYWPPDAKSKSDLDGLPVLKFPSLKSLERQIGRTKKELGLSKAYYRD
jgi:hypothetical protein